MDPGDPGDCRGTDQLFTVIWRQSRFSELVPSHVILLTILPVGASEGHTDSVLRLLMPVTSGQAVFVQSASVLGDSGSPLIETEVVTLPPVTGAPGLSNTTVRNTESPGAGVVGVIPSSVGRKMEDGLQSITPVPSTEAAAHRRTTAAFSILLVCAVFLELPES